MNRNADVIIAASATFSMLAVGLALSQEYAVDWRTIDGGGGVLSTGGDLELSGTIAQPDAGVAMIGGDLELTGGFWFAQAPGDCNTDGGVNLWDHGSFAACLNVSGPGGAASPECTCFDLNSDGTVDLLDFATFQSGFSGS